jgi:hypothetical protein
LIINWKENKEAGAICFEIRIPSKKNKYLLRKVPSKIYGSYFIMERNKNIFWFVNNSEYHHREMGLEFWNHQYGKINVQSGLLSLRMVCFCQPIFAKWVGISSANQGILYTVQSRVSDTFGLRKNCH